MCPEFSLLLFILLQLGVPQSEVSCSRFILNCFLSVFLRLEGFLTIWVPLRYLFDKDDFILQKKKLSK